MTKSTQLGLVDVEFSAEFNGSALRSKKIGIKSTHPPKMLKMAQNGQEQEANKIYF